MPNVSRFSDLRIGERFRFPADCSNALCAKVSSVAYYVESASDVASVGLTCFNVHASEPVLPEALPAPEHKATAAQRAADVATVRKELEGTVNVWADSEAAPDTAAGRRAAQAREALAAFERLHPLA